MTEKILPAAMRASDADRDAVLADLSEHFQAGRLTAAELDERTGQALAARTWGELSELLADLPATRSATQPATLPATLPATGGRPPSPAGRVARPPIVVLAGLGIVAAVLLGVAIGGWGVIWLLWPIGFIARRMTGCRVFTDR
jgi:Domain of unknown function (DUF1707)